MKSSILYNRVCVFCALSLTLLFCVVGPTSSDGSSSLLLQGIESLDQAYDDWDEKKFEESLTKFEMAAQTGQKDGLAEYWAGTAYFFLSLHHLFSIEKAQDKVRGTKNAKKGIDVLTLSIERNPDFSESYALRGVLRGILIKMKPFSVFSQGPEVGEDRKKALALDANNPRVHYLTGVSFWFAPEILGGSDKALEHLKIAEALFEKEGKRRTNAFRPSWGQSSCLAFIGDIYISQKHHKNAYDYYGKALAANPNDPLALRGMKKLDKLEDGMKE
jgi:tetratricopeptide (TPR) repeat protein